MQQKLSLSKSLVQIQAKSNDCSDYSPSPRRPWRPVTLRLPYLTALVGVTAGLIAVIQWLLYVSKRDQGIIFAKDVNDLPLRRSFCYLYLPTIISVVYSFLWAWVDLDIKRLEPFFQLSKPGGASGASSLLLNYPLEFLVILPFIAFKNRHWAVLSASTIMIMVFWGLTPTMSGIFAVRSLQMTKTVPGLKSKSYMTLAAQGNLSTIYAQSVYNIAWLNESLPAFMTRDLALSPFGPSAEIPFEAVETNYTGRTTRFSIDISCTEPELITLPGGITRYNGSDNCQFHAPLYRPFGGNDTSKPYDTMYVGYPNENGFADYYLSLECDESFAHYFFVRWSRSETNFILDPENAQKGVQAGQANATSLFCVPTYFQQDVNATISLPSNTVVDVQAIGQKQDLPEDLFNASTFEWAMSSGLAQFPPRGDFPTSGFPDQKARLENMPLNLEYLPKMAPFAIAVNQQPAEAYLDTEVLRASYQAAYRLLFARQLIDVLGTDMDLASEASGVITYSTQAVIVVPGFAYAATTLLGLICSLGVGLLLTLPRRVNALQQDPATVGDLVELVSSDLATTYSFTGLDAQDEQGLKTAVHDRMYCFHRNDTSGVVRLAVGETGALRNEGAVSCHYEPVATECTESEDFARVRPAEMKLRIGILFFIVHVATATIFLVLFAQSKRHQGLALPSQSTFVRQLVENYIPIVVATLMEPFWLVLNRLLCLLQPFEELRKGSALASRSIDVDYSSLPPQLLLWRALRARHFVMALVCMMVLAANILAVSLSGMMYEGSETTSRPAILASRYVARFRILSGTSPPFNTNQTDVGSQGGTTSDPFYMAMSNLTAHTALPPWTDSNYSYLAANTTSTSPDTNFQVQTQALGADLQCQPLSTGGKQNYTIKFSDFDTAAQSTLAVNLQRADGHQIRCADSAGSPQLKDPQIGHAALEIETMLTSNKSIDDDIYCRQHILMAWLRVNWISLKNNPNAKMRVSSHNETVLLCKPTLTFGSAEVIVDSTGHIQRSLSTNTTSDPATLNAYFPTSSPADLIAQANQFLTSTSTYRTLHQDAYPSDFLNYLIQQRTHDSSLLNYTLPIPSPTLAATYTSSVYKTLFAILIGMNQDLLFESPSSPSTTQGQILSLETRILFSTPTFIVSETILVCYILVTIYFYVRRPWKVLPRLPSSPASIIAFFVGSRAVRELDGVVEGKRKALREEWRWGYGSFVGIDGEVRVGIEREPFVVVPGKEGLSRRR